MKLFTRYTKLNLAWMIALFLLAGAGYYLVMRSILVRELDEDLVERKTRMQQYVAEKHHFPDGENFDDAIIRILKDGGNRIDSITMVDLIDRDKGKLQPFRQLSYVEHLNGTDYVVSIAKPLEGTRDLLQLIVLVTLATILLIVATSILLNRFLLRKLWRPFYKTLDEVKRFEIGRAEGVNLPDTDIDEFLFLNNSLAQALSRAEREFQSLKEFTENASHELQTPLAILHSKIDLLLQQEELSQRESELLTDAYGAIKRLSKLNQSLLLLARIDNRQFGDTEPIDLGKKIQDKLTQFNELWVANNLKVTADLDSAIISANPELIDILLNNLLSNASRYNLPDGSIQVRLHDRQLVVDNSGSHAELDSSRIFQRFYKPVVNSTGNGLGLSLVRQICDLYRIAVEYTYSQGRHRFTLRLPPL